MYLDTCIEPWAGGYTDPTVPPGRAHQLRDARGGAGAARRQRARTDRRAHARRQSRAGVALRQAGAAATSPTDIGVDAGKPANRAPSGARWRASSASRSIHIAERDTQVTNKPKQPNEFVNTWSVDGFVSEGCQPAELGWGTHERNFPRDGKRHDFGCLARDLPEAAGRGDARAHLDAEGRALPWLPDHAQRSDLDRRLLHGARGRAGRCTGRPATTPTTPATPR